MFTYRFRSVYSCSTLSPTASFMQHISSVALRAVHSFSNTESSFSTSHVSFDHSHLFRHESYQHS